MLQTSRIGPFVLLALSWGVGSATAADSPVSALKAWLKIPADKRPALAEQPFAKLPLSKQDAEAAKTELWNDHAATIRATRAAEMKAKVIELNGKKMPFGIVDHPTPKGAKVNGRSLFISMHGGGNAPPAVNDGQWKNQIALAKAYKPQEGIYLAPRAPTDTWNLWHEAHIDTFFDRIIESLIVLENVNPNRVYILGYSAGGDGVYQLAPRMADRWAAASMMAGHPNETSPLGLRNVPFAIQVGANDAGFKRNEVAAKWGASLDALSKEDPGGYAHFCELHAGKPHWMDFEDRKAIPWMEAYTRNPIPEKIVWKQDDVIHDRFYWLATPKDKAVAGLEIKAERKGQSISLNAPAGTEITVRFNDAMLNLEQPITIIFNGQPLNAEKLQRTIATLHRTLSERGDPELVFSAESKVVIP